MADTGDLKSPGSNPVRVRVPPRPSVQIDSICLGVTETDGSPEIPGESVGFVISGQRPAVADCTAFCTTTAPLSAPPCTANLDRRLHRPRNTAGRRGETGPKTGCEARCRLDCPRQSPAGRGVRCSFAIFEGGGGADAGTAQEEQDDDNQPNRCAVLVEDHQGWGAPPPGVGTVGGMSAVVPVLGQLGRRVTVLRTRSVRDERPDDGRQPES